MDNFTNVSGDAVMIKMAPIDIISDLELLCGSVVSSKPVFGLDPQVAVGLNSLSHSLSQLQSHYTDACTLIHPANQFSGGTWPANLPPPTSNPPSSSSSSSSIPSLPLYTSLPAPTKPILSSITPQDSTFGTTNLNTASITKESLSDPPSQVDFTVNTITSVPSSTLETSFKCKVPTNILSSISSPPSSSPPPTPLPPALLQPVAPPQPSGLDLTNQTNQHVDQHRTSLQATSRIQSDIGGRKRPSSSLSSLPTTLCPEIPRTLPPTSRLPLNSSPAQISTSISIASSSLLPPPSAPSLPLISSNVSRLPVLTKLSPQPPQVLSPGTSLATNPSTSPMASLQPASSISSLPPVASLPRPPTSTSKSPHTSLPPLPSLRSLPPLPKLPSLNKPNP